MRGLLAVIISFIIITFGIIYIITASQIHYMGTQAEIEINHIFQDFMDRVADAGFIIPKDYDNLIQALGATGGTFSLNLTVERLFYTPTIPQHSQLESSDWKLEYHLVHSLGSQDGTFSQMTAPLNLQRHDKITLNVEQLTAMTHELLETRTFTSDFYLRTWNFERGVRNTGNRFQD